MVVTLDDRRTRDAAVADETAFAEQCPDGVLVVDEVQREPELLLAIEASIDRGPYPHEFPRREGGLATASRGAVPRPVSLGQSPSAAARLGCERQ